MVLLKKIRNYLNMSQQEFAQKMNVSFATVNRWENVHASPNRLAQDKLYDLCMENSVPLLEIINERIAEAVNGIDRNDGTIILYHGSKSGIVGKIEPKSRQKCDFGQGFYMGTDPVQPLTLICDFDKSKFYILSVKLEGLNVFDVPADIEWAMLVAYHRGKMDKIKGSAFYKKYESLAQKQDFIVGSIANDRMFYVLDNFFLGNITNIALIKSLSALQLGKQYVAITQSGCQVIHIEKEIPLSLLERKYLQHISEENRGKGISLANDICKKYRREGKFFDEILDAAELEV